MGFQAGVNCSSHSKYWSGAAWLTVTSFLGEDSEDETMTERYHYAGFGRTGGEVSVCGGLKLAVWRDRGLS